MAIGKNELIAAAARLAEVRIEKQHVATSLDAIVKAIGGLVMEGNEVILGNLGRFVPVIKEAHKSRNPATGEEVDTPARVQVKFKVNANFKMKMRDLDASTFQAGKAGNAAERRPVEQKAARDKASAKEAAPKAKGRRH